MKARVGTNVAVVYDDGSDTARAAATAAAADSAVVFANESEGEYGSFARGGASC